MFGGYGIAVPGDESTDFRFEYDAEAGAHARGHEAGECEDV